MGIVLLLQYSSTGESPFYIHFLREGRLPVDLNLKEITDEFNTFADIKTDFGKKAYKAQEEVIQRINKKHLLDRKKMEV